MTKTTASSTTLGRQKQPIATSNSRRKNRKTCLPRILSAAVTIATMRLSIWHVMEFRQNLPTMALPLTRSTLQRQPEPPRRRRQDGIHHDVPEDGISFSACLTVMDDNFRLSEWIAYHYFTLNLRWLVILNDPRSGESPTSILDQWRHLMRIEEWTVSDLKLRRKVLRDIHASNVNQRTSAMFGRQPNFYGRCAAFLKEHNRTWTAFVDSDEFISMDGLVVTDAATRMRRPGGVAQLFQELHTAAVGKTEEADAAHSGGHCVTLARTYYSAVESKTEDLQRGVPAGLDGRRLDTMRWRYRTTLNDAQNNGLAKSIVDVSQVDAAHEKFGIHRALPSCPYPVIRDRKPLSIRHYLGSWEEYTYRNDARMGGQRNRVIWAYRAQLRRGGMDDTIRPWLQGLFEYMGKETAMQLLGNAGLPVDYRGPAPNDPRFALPQEHVETMMKRHDDFAAFMHQQKS